MRLQVRAEELSGLSRCVRVAPPVLENLLWSFSSRFARPERGCAGQCNAVTAPSGTSLASCARTPPRRLAICVPMSRATGAADEIATPPGFALMPCLMHPSVQS